MKISFLVLLATWAFPLVSTFGATATPAPTSRPKPTAVETNWPGITVTAYRIARLPGNRVSVKFIYMAGRTAPNETNIADRPIEAFPSGLDSSDQAPVEFYPYSIEKLGRLVDEATGKVFPPAELKPGDAVHPGPTETLEVIRPNDAFFLGGVFECPPVNQDDPPKDQWVAFQLPGLKTPLKGVLLPREENVPLNFFPKPRSTAASPTPAPNG